MALRKIDRFPCRDVRRDRGHHQPTAPEAPPPEPSTGDSPDGTPGVTGRQAVPGRIPPTDWRILTKARYRNERAMTRFRCP